MSKEKGGETIEARIAARQQRRAVPLEGLRVCRVAAALTQEDLAKLISSNKTTIADLEQWDKADSYMLQRLCQALKVRSEDLISRHSVENPSFEEQQQGESERRRQVNRIKKRGHDTGAPGTVLLRGLKARRLEAGLTQRELARMVGTNQMTIFELEKKYATRGAYVKTIRKLSEVLKVSPADLICRD